MAPSSEKPTPKKEEKKQEVEVKTEGKVPQSKEEPVIRIQTQQTKKMSK